MQILKSKPILIYHFTFEISKFYCSITSWVGEIISSSMLEARGERWIHTSKKAVTSLLGASILLIETPVLPATTSRHSMILHPPNLWYHKAFYEEKYSGVRNWAMIDSVVPQPKKAKWKHAHRWVLISTVLVRKKYEILLQTAWFPILFVSMVGVQIPCGINAQAQKYLQICHGVG